MGLTIHWEGGMGRAKQATSIAEATVAPRAAVTVRELRRFLDEAVTWAQRTYVGAMRRASVRRELHRFARDHQLDKARSSAYAAHSALVTVIAQMTRLWRAGANLAELLRFGECLLMVARALAATAPRSLDVLDLEEQRLDGYEDEQQMRRNVRPHTAAGLVEEIATCERLVAVNSERALALRVRLQQLLAGGSVELVA